MRERHALASDGAAPRIHRVAMVELACCGCGRTVGELHSDENGGLARIVGGNTRGGVRYETPAVRPLRAGGGPVSDEIMRFFCVDRCGIRYALPREALAVLLRRAVREGAGASVVVRVPLPVRGRRDGRAPTLRRRAARRGSGELVEW